MSRPNILFIMSDDHAANAISCYGSRFAEIAPTPNMDRIAREGMRLDTCFCANAICTPSRATIMTGQHSHMNGVRTLADGLDPERPNVAKLLQASGYQTAVIGKWHIKRQPSGFDYYNVLPAQGDYFNPRFKTIGKPWENGNKGGEHVEGYTTDLIGDDSLEWLKTRDRDKPFFLMCHHKAPHDNWEFHPRHAQLFEDIEMPEPDSLWEDKSHRSDATREQGSDIADIATRRMQRDNWPHERFDLDSMDRKELTRRTYQLYTKAYLRTVKAIDENVGRLLDYLDEEGIADDTVVIYTSDQGQFLGEHDYYDKRWIYEESLQMPFLARYPKEMSPGGVGTDLCQNIDFAPTFLDYANVETPGAMQGRSIRSVLSGKTPSDWRKSVYYRYWMHMASHLNPAHYGVRTDRYKLIFFYGLPLDAKGAVDEPATPGLELYDLEEDPLELKNVYDDPAYADVVTELKAELLRLKEECGDRDEDYPELLELREKLW